MTTKTKAAIALAVWTNLRRVLLAGLAVIALASCGSGGGDEAPTPTPNSNVGSGWITNPGGVEGTREETFHASGSAFFSDFYGDCCTGQYLGSAITDTGVTVTWSNAAGGAGSAMQFAKYSPSGWTVIEHTWTAWIPLAVGVNVVTMTASDPGGNIGRATFTITRLPGNTPPTVSSTTPIHGDPNFPVFSVISAVFSEEMASASITEATFQLVDGSGNPVSGTVTYTDNVLTWNFVTGTYTATGNVATFTPANLLAAFSPYTATITDGVKDVAGNSMAANYVWSFTTGAPDTTPPR